MGAVDQLVPGGRAEVDDEVLADAYAPPRPDWLRVNFVASADGAMTVDGLAGGLSGDGDKRVFGLLRAMSDVVLVGAGTVRTEGYRRVRVGPRWRALRDRLELDDQPVVAVVTASCALGADAPLLRPDEGGAPGAPATRDIIVITTRHAPEERRSALAAAGAELLTTEPAGPDDTGVDLAAALRALRDRGLRRVLCEGGPRLLRGLLGEDLVDELCLTVAPVLAAGDASRIVHGAALHPPRRLVLAGALRDGDELLLRYHLAGR
jgi:5-amino-6-(5-phosphoribosylamino)uracil reductase